MVVQENDLELVGKPTGTAIFKIKVLNENNEVIVLPDYIEEGVTLSGSFDSLDKICADLEKNNFEVDSFVSEWSENNYNNKLKNKKTD